MRTRSFGLVPARRRTRNCTRLQPDTTNNDAMDTDILSQDNASLFSVESRSDTRGTKVLSCRPAKKRKAATTRHRGPGSKRSRPDQRAKRIPKGDQPRFTMTGKPAPWHTLPYHVLILVFHHVGYPLVNDHLHPTPSMGNLLRMALVCKAFAEPALTALYYSPPLLPPSRAYNLFNHLRSQNENSTYNYRSKVKYIDIEAMSQLLHKTDKKDPIDLAELITYTPNLRGMRIHMISDRPKLHTESLRKYLDSSTHQNWRVYQDSLFESLELSNINLREWKWMFEVQSGQIQLKALPSLRSTNTMRREHLQHCPVFSGWKEIHGSRSFQSIEELTLTQYDWPSAELRGAARAHHADLAGAIGALPRLKKLAFECSLLVSDHLLPMLPATLESFRLTDCSEVTTDGLQKFLSTHGSQIRELILNHNIHLGLLFLTDFAGACPRAEILSMNFTYVNGHVPQTYDAITLDADLPTWPESLQSLELLHIRKWPAQNAEQFFTSLIESAAALTDLRKVVIKASLEISWRDRATFRDKWIADVQKVFLKASNVSNAHLSSISTTSAKPSRQTAQSKNVFSHVAISRDPSDSRSDSDAPIMTRRSSRLQQQDSDTYDLPDAEPGVPKRQLRKVITDEDDDSTPEDSSTSRSGKSSKSRTPEPFIQGLCSTVDIRIDSLRPKEEQFKEEDFLDSEASGDESWNEDREDAVEDRYAW